MIDAHIHLDQYADIEETIQQWQEAGIEAVVAVSTDLRSSYRTLELKQRFPTFIYAAIGFHPEQPLPNQADWNEWTRLLQQERQHLAAIGESGFRTIQRKPFRIFPTIAIYLNRSLSLLSILPYL